MPAIRRAAASACRSSAACAISVVRAAALVGADLGRHVSPTQGVNPLSYAARIRPSGAVRFAIPAGVVALLRVRAHGSAI
ncbi:hypothetical protein G6F32_014794 [Rhizopus arrhizus]|nr:hypothetical protein G6F32_014794 [Rhizopus arrhizus]